MIGISVVIPAFDCSAHLRLCLLALVAQERMDMSDVEVIVAEYGPESGVSKTVHSLTENFRL